MARVVWPYHVIDQLDAITAYIALDNPVAAQALTKRIVALGDSLAMFPSRGRPARAGSRVLTTVPPYILRYRVIDDDVVILDIRHGRRRPLQ